MVESTASPTWKRVATLHLGPGAILVALTLAFRRDSTTDTIEDAIREITHALQKADGRIAYVYVLRRIGLTNQVADASDVRFGSLAEIVSRPRHVRSSPQSRHSSARVARPLSAISGSQRDVLAHSAKEKAPMCGLGARDSGESACL